MLAWLTVSMGAQALLLRSRRRSTFPRREGENDGALAHARTLAIATQFGVNPTHGSAHQRRISRADRMSGTVLGQISLYSGARTTTKSPVMAGAERECAAGRLL